MSANVSQIAFNACATTNITSSAYVTLFSSTSITTAKLELTDSSGKIIKVAMGPAGSEIDICTVAPSGTVVIPYYIPAGTRISLKAIDSTNNATTGYIAVSLILW